MLCRSFSVPGESQAMEMEVAMQEGRGWTVIDRLRPRPFVSGLNPGSGASSTAHEDGSRKAYE